MAIEGAPSSQLHHPPYADVTPSAATPTSEVFAHMATCATGSHQGGRHSEKKYTVQTYHILSQSGEKGGHAPRKTGDSRTKLHSETGIPFVEQDSMAPQYCMWCALQGELTCNAAPLSFLQLVLLVLGCENFEGDVHTLSDRRRRLHSPAPTHGCDP